MKIGPNLKQNIKIDILTENINHLHIRTEHTLFDYKAEAVNKTTNEIHIERICILNGFCTHIQTRHLIEIYTYSTPYIMHILQVFDAYVDAHFGERHYHE